MPYEEPITSNGLKKNMYGLVGELVTREQLGDRLGKANDANSVLFTANERLQQEVIDLRDKNLKLRTENAQLKEDYADLAKHNANIHQTDSETALEGIESEKKLSDIVSVLPINPEEISKKGVWKSWRLFMFPYEKEIKKLKDHIKYMNQQEQVVEKWKPWWSWLPSLRG